MSNEKWLNEIPTPISDAADLYDYQTAVETCKELERRCGLAVRIMDTMALHLPDLIHAQDIMPCVVCGRNICCSSRRVCWQCVTKAYKSFFKLMEEEK